jgi:hypothetical protein
MAGTFMPHMHMATAFHAFHDRQMHGSDGGDAALSMCGTNNRHVFAMQLENKLF